jgi:hypothetical protein
VSEFSESFHLRADQPEAAVALLRAAGLAGFVFPPRGTLVPFVCPREGDAIERILAANTGLLVHYVYAADHGVWVHAYVGSTRAARLEASFEEKRSAFEPDPFVRLGLLSRPEAERLARWVASAHDWTARREANEHLVAKMLRLGRYAWFSYAYELNPAPDAPDEGRIVVEASAAAPPARPATAKKIAKKPLATKRAPAKKTAKKLAVPSRAPAKKTAKKVAARRKGAT